jgi:hypothetical protein
VGRHSSQLVEAARQRLTKIWWDEHRDSYKLVCSQTVIDECARGDRKMAELRLALLEGIPLLDLTDEISEVAKDLVERRIIPEKAADDAVHIAVASVHKIDYLLTWNCKHLANPHNWRRISNCLADHGCRATVICTPEELIGDDY